MPIIATAPAPASTRLDQADTVRLPSYFALLALAAFTLLVDGVPLIGVARILALTEDATTDLYLDHVLAEARAGRIPSHATTEDRQTVREHLLPTLTGSRAYELAVELDCGDRAEAARIAHRLIEDGVSLAAAAAVLGVTSAEVIELSVDHLCADSDAVRLAGMRPGTVEATSGAL